MMHRNQAFRIMLDRFEETQGNYLDTSPLTKLSVNDLGDSAFMLKLLREFLDIEILDFLEEPAKSDVNFFETCIQEDTHGGGIRENCLKYASNAVKKDKLFFLKLIEEFSYYQSLTFADETVKFDSKIAEAVFELLPDDLNAVEYCSPSVRAGYTFIKNAVSFNGLNLEFASDELKLDKTIVKQAISNNAEALEYASEILRNDQELALLAAKSNYKAAKFIGQSLMSSGKFISSLIEEVEIINYDLFDLIPEKFKSDKQILKRIIHKHDNTLAIELKDFINENDREFFLETVRENGKALRFAGEKLRDDKALVFIAMQNTVEAFRYVSERLSNDPELATMAVEARPAMLRRVGKHAQDDNQVVLAAVLRQGTALDWASDRLRDDKELVTVALSQDPFALRYASERLRNDRALVFAACEKNIHAYLYAGATLFSDKEFAMLVAPHVYNCLDHFSQELENDQDVLAVYINERDL